MLSQILISTILVLITVVILLQMFSMSFIIIILGMLASLLSIPLYKKCKSLVKKPRRRTFWSSYWYDMQCVFPIIIYGVVMAGLIVWIANYVS